MDSTTLVYIVISLGAVLAVLSIWRGILAYNLNAKIERIASGIEQKTFEEHMPMPQQMQQPIQTPQQQPIVQAQPQQVAPKPTKQDFELRVKEMNEAKKKKRIERELAALEEQKKKILKQ